MKTQILGFCTPWIAYAVITLLHVILPGRKIKGYVRDDKSGEILNYRLNGILVLPASIIIWDYLTFDMWGFYFHGKLTTTPSAKQNTANSGTLTQKK
jgi:hypothetical protein